MLRQPCHTSKKLSKTKKILPFRETFRLNCRNYLCNSNPSHQTMKRLALPLLLAAGLLAQVASAQTSSSTPVIGYYKQTIQPGNTAVVAGFTTKKEFQGAMTSAAAAGAETVITQTGATFGSFTNHFVEILSGSKTGLILDIVSNTGTTINVSGVVALDPNTSYCVRKHVTLGALLPGGAGLDAGSDTVSIVNSDSSVEEFTYNGSNWENVATLDDGTEKVIYPGQGFIVFRGAATAATVTIGGNEVSYVKYGPTMVPLYAGAPGNPMRNYVGAINPLVSDAEPGDIVALGSFGLVAALTAGSDTVDVFSINGSFTTTGTYVSNGGNLEDVGSLDDGTNVPIRNGTAFRVIIDGATDRVTSIPQSVPNP
jgi:hypothetical protein